MKLSDRTACKIQLFVGLWGLGITGPAFQDNLPTLFLMLAAWSSQVVMAVMRLVPKLEGK